MRPLDAAQFVRAEAPLGRPPAPARVLALGRPAAGQAVAPRPPARVRCRGWSWGQWHGGRNESRGLPVRGAPKGVKLQAGGLAGRGEQPRGLAGVGDWARELGSEAEEKGRRCSKA